MNHGQKSLLAALMLVLAAPAPSKGAPAAPAATQPATQPSALEVELAVRDLRSGDWILQASAMRLLARWKVRAAAGPLRQCGVGAIRPGCGAGRWWPWQSWSARPPCPTC